ncbi:MAG TPA: helix-turn-helix domain-containing protein [Candidatus Methylacidiphilales bacterium]|nr:helix-turn-helix domain-containing protein [Candidatus Methylacidiphilales bacterium]
MPHIAAGELKQYQAKGGKVVGGQAVMGRLQKTIQLLDKNLTAPERRQLMSAASPFEFLLKATRLAVIHGFGLENDQSSEKLNRAILRGLETSQRLRERAEPTLGTSEAAKLLNVSPETIRQKVKRRQLLALSKGSQDRVFPRFQFHEHQVLPGFSDALAALGPISPYRALSFFLDDHPELGGKPAIEALRKGRIDEVIRSAHRFVAAHGT